MHDHIGAWIDSSGVQLWNFQPVCYRSQESSSSCAHFSYVSSLLLSSLHPSPFLCKLPKSNYIFFKLLLQAVTVTNTQSKHTAIWQSHMLHSMFTIQDAFQKSLSRRLAKAKYARTLSTFFFYPLQNDLMMAVEFECFPCKILPNLKLQVTEQFRTRIPMFLSSKIKLLSFLDDNFWSSKEYESYY